MSGITVEIQKLGIAEFLRPLFSATGSGADQFLTGDKKLAAIQDVEVIVV